MGSKIMVSLQPFPAHCLEWLCEFTKEKRSRVISDALIQLYGEFKRVEEGRDEKKMD